MLQIQLKYLLFRGRKIYEPPRYMTSDIACQQLLKIIERKEDSGQKCGKYNI